MKKPANWIGTDSSYFNNNFEYIEQITNYINRVVGCSRKGDLEYDLLFLWDSVGSVPCKMTYDGKGGKQHNAAVLADKIGMGINQRISGSRRSDSKYENTLVIVNQPWVELPDNPFGQPKIKAKGGEAIWLNSSLVFLFGNQKNAGTTKITAVKDKRKVKFATRTKVSVMKNHINGLGYEDGRILVTAHGFLAGKDAAEEKKSIEKYKSEHSEYWKDIIGIGSDFKLEEESVTFKFYRVTKTLLVDGNNLFKIGYHGVREYYHKGNHIGGIYHFVNTIT